MTEKVRSDLDKICEIIRETVPAVQIYLFGSYAYGEPHKDSDYDIYVVLSDDGPRPLEASIAIRRALCGQTNMPMDILAAAESSFHNRLGVPTLENTVYKKGMLLYDGPESAERRMA